MCQADVQAIVAIELSVSVSPWTLETFQSCLAAGYLGWALEIDQKIVGFVIISLSVDECHVLNLCVLHHYQHQGFGKQLLTHALAYAKTTQAKIVYLEVRRSNARAISLYRQAHFQLVGERKNYYPTLTGLEDALIFAKNLCD